MTDIGKDGWPKGRVYFTPDGIIMGLLSIAFCVMSLLYIEKTILLNKELDSREHYTSEYCSLRLQVDSVYMHLGVLANPLLEE